MRWPTTGNKTISHIYVPRVVARVTLDTASVVGVLYITTLCNYMAVMFITDSAPRRRQLFCNL